MFLGTHPFRLDEKARLVLPARFREQLAAGLVLARGQEHCVYVFPAAEFERVHEGLRRAPLTSRQARDFLRVLLSGASDGVPDRQGRLVVPPALRAWAGLDRDCVAVGAGARVELWDAAAWATYREATEGAFAEAAQEVVPGLL